MRLISLINHVIETQHHSSVRVGIPSLALTGLRMVFLRTDSCGMRGGMLRICTKRAWCCGNVCNGSRSDDVEFMSIPLGPEVVTRCHWLGNLRRQSHRQIPNKTGTQFFTARLTGNMLRRLVKDVLHHQYDQTHGMLKLTCYPSNIVPPVLQHVSTVPLLGSTEVGCKAGLQMVPGGSPPLSSFDPSLSLLLSFLPFHKVELS